MRTKTSCFNTGALVDYVRAKNPENLHFLWAPLQGVLAEGEDPERFLTDAKNYVSIEICRQIMEQTRQATSDEMAVYKAAFEHGRQKELGIMQPRFFQAILGLKHAMRKAQNVHGKFPAGKRIEIVSFSDIHSVVRLHWSSDISLSRDFCLFAKGKYQAMPTMFHFPPARLWERTCLFEGGPYCEYQLWWDKKPARRAFGLRSALDAGFLRPPEGQMATNKIQTKATPAAAQAVVAENRPVKDQRITRANLKFANRPTNQDQMTDTTASFDTGGRFEVRHPEVQEMEPISTPSNGVVQKFQNVFTGIQEHLSLMLADIDARHPYFEQLKGIEGMIKKGADLTKHLLGSPKDGKDRIKAASLNLQKVTKEKDLAKEPLRGTETVLIVEYEDMLLDVSQQMLKAIGYKVIVARTGKEAIEIYKKRKDDVDMVILDMIMPDMGGGEAYDKLKEINPDIRVLLSSGYSIEGEARQTLARGCNGFIQKPFSIKQLSEKIRAILDDPVHPIP
jgi:CheY-like chemotaxis protein